MKKILYGTTALVAAGFITSAASAAEPIKLSVGGHMWQFFGFVDQEDDTPSSTGVASVHNNFGHHSDTEVYFTGSTKLDNGLSVKAVIELEAERTSASPNARQADQQYLEIGGNFGVLSMGERFQLGHRIHNNAPQFGIDWTNFRTAFVTDNAAGTNTTTANVVSGPTEHMTSTNAVLTRSSSEISYVTPAFYGFNAGVAYVPNVNNRGVANEATALHDALTAGVVYGGTLFGAKVGADVGVVRAERASNSGGKLTGLQSGLKVGMNGFTVGGSYLRVSDNIDKTAAQTSQSGGNDGHAWDAGVSYENGPWGVSLTYFTSSWEGTVPTNGGAAGSGADVIKLWSVAGKYTLGPGVVLDAAVVHGDYKD